MTQGFVGAAAGGLSILKTLDLTLGMVSAISTLMSGRMQVPRR